MEQATDLPENLGDDSPDDAHEDSEENVKALLASCGITRAFNTITQSDIHVASTDYYRVLAFQQDEDCGIAVSDAGADTSVTDSTWHVTEYIAGKQAKVIGWDQKPGQKTMRYAHRAFTWLDQGHGKRQLIGIYNTITNPDTKVSLLSEYQLRESGAIVDSVSRKHKLTADLYGTQRCVVPDGSLEIPFQLRESLMTFRTRKPTTAEIDEYIDTAVYLNNDTPWDPSQHTDDETMLFRAQMARKHGQNDPEGTNSQEDLYFFDCEQGEPQGLPPQVVTTDSGNRVRVNLVEDSKTLYYFDPSDNANEGSVRDGRYEFDWTPEAWQTDVTFPEDNDVVDHLLNQLQTDQLIQTPEEFDTFAFAVQTAHEIIRSHDEIQSAHVNHKKTITLKDLEALQPCLNFAPLRVIRQTLECTTQWALDQVRYPLRRHRVARFAELNKRRIEETVSTDDIKANCRSYGGSYYSQVFFGSVSRMINVYGMRSKRDFPQVYQDFIREEGIPSALRRDQAQNERSEAVQEINRKYLIKDQWSEADNQQQNPVEVNGVRILKERSQTLMDRTNCPDPGWEDAQKYISQVYNILAQDALNGMNPFTKRHGYTKDISGFLHYRFRQPVYYLEMNDSYPSSKERPGYWIGVSENVGDALTYIVRDAVTNKRVHKSVVRPADDPSMPNHRAIFDEVVHRAKTAERVVPIVMFEDEDQDESSVQSNSPWEDTVPVQPATRTQRPPIERLHRPRPKVQATPQCKATPSPV